MSDSFVISWIVAHQVPLSMGFLRQGYWNGLPFPSPGDLPDPVIKLKSPSLAGGFFTTFYNDLSKTVHSGNVIMNFGLFLSFAYYLANMKLFY